MPVLRFVRAVVQRTLRFELFGYLFASALALALDTGVYAGALALGLPLALAAALGFAAGVSCAYAVSVRLVFKSRRLDDRSSEFAFFVAIGLLGLLLTEGLLWLLVTRLDLHPLTAKMATAAVVFAFNFGLRKAMLFTRTEPFPSVSNSRTSLATRPPMNSSSSTTHP